MRIFILFPLIYLLCSTAAVAQRGMQVAKAKVEDTTPAGIEKAKLGYQQLNEGRLDLAEESLQDALELLGKVKTPNAEELAQAHSYLGLVYLSQGKYAQSQEQLHRALSLRQTVEKNRDAFIAASYNDLGLAYSQTDKDRALDYYEQAHKMYIKLYGENDPRIAISNINTGIIYRDLELFGDAVNNFENALNIWEKAHPGPHAGKAIALYNLGQTHMSLRDHKAASAYYEKALTMYRNVYGSKHPEISSVLNAMGSLLVSEGKFDEALALYQDALKANTTDFSSDNISDNPSLSNYYNGAALLHTLMFKAQAFEAKYTMQSLKFSDLDEALKVLSLCDKLIDELRRHNTHESDKITLGVMASEVYADGVRIAYLAALNAFKKQSYYELAFYYAEKSKGAVLLDAISDSHAKSFAGISPSLLEKEQELKAALALASRRLAEKPSEQVERQLRETAFDLKREYDTFIANLEREYPEYFNLKFNVKAPTVAELKALLPSATALISYFIDDKKDHLYIFVLHRDKFKVLQRTLTSDFNRYITGLRNSVYFQEIGTLKLTAYELGKILLPRLPSSVTDLVILPAGPLSTLPFETLMTKDPGETSDYSKLPYLLNRYGLRYEFSGGLIAQKKQRPASALSSPSIFLCAPIKFPHKPSLSELPGTEKEVKDISNLFAGENLKASVATGQEAIEKLVKSPSIKDYHYLHFATHGIVNESRPELSRIFLANDESNDGDLFAGEIYNLELNANLVTLSACQTGMGQLVKGEGVIGLSRALVYAGAKNIVVSFWSVADESTAILMSEFYRDLITNRDKNSNQALSAALRRSKLRVKDDPKFSAPFYWAPFVLIGY